MFHKSTVIKETKNVDTRKHGNKACNCWHNLDSFSNYLSNQIYKYVCFSLVFYKLYKRFINI